MGKLRLPTAGPTLFLAGLGDARTREPSSSYLFHSALKKKKDQGPCSVPRRGGSQRCRSSSSCPWLSFLAPPGSTQPRGGGERRSSFCSGVYEFTSFYLNLSLSVFSCPRRNCPTTLGNKYYQRGQRLLQEPSLLQDKQASGGVQTFLTAHRGQSKGSPP